MVGSYGLLQYICSLPTVACRTCVVSSLCKCVSETYSMIVTVLCVTVNGQHKYVRVFCICISGMGRVSSVRIATRYGLGGPGIESGRGRDFPHPYRPALGPTQPPIQWVAGLSRAQSGRGVALITHPHLAPKLK